MLDTTVIGMMHYNSHCESRVFLTNVSPENDKRLFVVGSCTIRDFCWLDILQVKLMFMRSSRSTTGPSLLRMNYTREI